MNVTDLKETLFGESEDEVEIGESEHGPIVRVLLAVRQSLTYFTLALGVVMIVTGFAVQVAFTNQGVLAAMFVIWGVSALGVGTVGFGLVKALRMR